MKVYTLLIGTALAISHVGYGMDKETGEIPYRILKALPCEKGVAVIVDDLLKQMMRAQTIPPVLVEKHNEFLKVLTKPTLGMDELMGELVDYQKAAMRAFKLREY
jgi:hypothetical protein